MQTVLPLLPRLYISCVELYISDLSAIALVQPSSPVDNKRACFVMGCSQCNKLADNGHAYSGRVMYESLDGVDRRLFGLGALNAE